MYAILQSFAGAECDWRGEALYFCKLEKPVNTGQDGRHAENLHGFDHSGKRHLPGLRQFLGDLAGKGLNDWHGRSCKALNLRSCTQALALPGDWKNNINR